ncbi:MAP/microtubule affinity-regulating kinase 4 [Favolaschia claudopus]|uniref:MAP/microtubule affinity-regulating kinase 4 n=1 Tax=Favolaschia claudopus TaxID=2862362 RepID=A0AAW0B1X2_9AGAR
MPSAEWDNRPPSPSSTASSFDDNDEEEEEFNLRDTVADAISFYTCSGEGKVPDFFLLKHSGAVKDDLCPDAGLVRLSDTLLWFIHYRFGGSLTIYFGERDLATGQRVVIKAVHLHSREFAVIRFLSSPMLRDDPMNHCIQVEEEDLGFIVMEQWSSQLIDDEVPCCLRLFLAALRQCIEHCVFMHRHRVAHLDISLRNLLTDYKGHYAYIDYGVGKSAVLTTLSPARFPLLRATEVPPECASFGGDCPDAFKADVWALAVLILRACKVGISIPSSFYLFSDQFRTSWLVIVFPPLYDSRGPMLNENPDDRPSRKKYWMLSTRWCQP